jgi:hypothetical protein
MKVFMSITRCRERMMVPSCLIARIALELFDLLLQA